MFIRSANIIVVSVVMGTLATVAMGLRFWARKMSDASYGADDFVAMGGLVLTLGICALNIVGVIYAHIGAHAEFITEGPEAGFPVAKYLIAYGKVFFAMQVLHTCAMPVVKSSLLIFYRRLFGISRGFKIATNVVAVFIGAWWIAIFLTTIFQCYPVSSNWAITEEGFQNCIKYPHAFYEAAALTNVASDIAIIAIPFPLVLKLQMATYHKVAILAYILTGALVVVAGVGRTVSYFTTNQYSNDWSYETYYWFIWSVIEPAFGVVGICLPVLRPLFAKVIPAAVTNVAKAYLSGAGSGSRQRGNKSYGSNTQRSHNRGYINYSEDQEALTMSQSGAYPMRTGRDLQKQEPL